MIIVLGATGHIGSQVIKLLSQKDDQVIGITHDEKNRFQIESSGAEAAVADVNDVEQLTKVFERGDVLYFLNPPGDISKDPSAEEKDFVAKIIEAIKKSGIKKVVAESTYGAQSGEKLGNLGVLYEMEKALEKLDTDMTIIRGAYYFTNWEMSLESAKTEGKIYSMYPPDFKLPMVDPKDIAEFATQKLTSNTNEKLNFIEGPQQYSPNDVAAAFSIALRKPVEAVEIKREGWQDFLTNAGFSAVAAESMINMTQLTLDAEFESENANRGTTNLEEYVAALLNER
ncbi:MAG: NAD-dependent epimerase/dehydratase family protein [Flavobacterium sp.]|uniref:NmrA family NAD(P)-binding protein n=1 Tax=Flavobacterium sp. TaxID=239 RepID=UPI001216579A|nr:NAD(P)H-binding protein [Flavobacterium sp.]RZJ64455.1 MAG: NAD-dependent epimerase/dehydratase family protein [Flavobacterium sp.]